MNYKSWKNSAGRLNRPYSTGGQMNKLVFEPTLLGSIAKVKAHLPAYDMPYTLYTFEVEPHGYDMTTHLPASYQVVVYLGEPWQHSIIFHKDTCDDIYEAERFCQGLYELLLSGLCHLSDEPSIRVNTNTRE